MKLNDSDYIQWYNATKKTKAGSEGNDVIIFGDQSFVPEIKLNIKDEQAYKRFVDDLSDSLVTVESELSADVTAKGFKEAIQAQIDYHQKYLNYYQQLMDQFK